MSRDTFRLLILIVILTAIVISIINTYNFAFADEVEYFIICKPDGEINVRGTPRIRSEIVGCKSFGDKVISDGKEKNGFVHIMGLNAEVTEGWIYKGLLVRDKPIESSGKCQVFNAGRVACRKYVDGKVTKWLKDGSEVEIYAISEEWCVTNYGYIKTEFLTVNAKVWQ